MAAKKNVNTAAAPVAEPAVAEPVAAPVADADVPAVAVDAAASPAEQDLNARFGQVLERMQGYMGGIRELVAIVKALQKDVQKLQKQKEGRRARRAPAAEGGKARKPSGFAKPTLLTKDLCDFLSVPADSRLARNEVTSLLIKYVKDNKLYDAKDKRIIRPDGKLQALLGLGEGQDVTYFNLQHFIKNHFVKDAPLAAAPAVEATA